MMTGASDHIPVLLDDVLGAIAPKDGECYVDGTFGAGGYSRAILDAADCRLHAFDRDPAAVQAGQALVSLYGGRLRIHHALFGDMEDVLVPLGEAPVDGIALDVGVSSMQLDQSVRGFSFQSDGPLDMRMSSEGESAADFLNGAPEALIAQVIRNFGEERQSRRIARAIAVSRKERPLQSTGDLLRIVESVLGNATKHKTHPATRTFQGIRIYINDELGQLVRGLRAAERLLRPAGRLVVVAFHSLEDRIVKKFLAERSGALGQPSRHEPARPSDAPAPSFQLLFKGAVVAGSEETENNPRARSAKLRAAVRTDAASFPLDLGQLGLPQGVEI